MSTTTDAPGVPVERCGQFLLFPRTTEPLHHRPDLLGNLRVARVEPDEGCTDLIRKEVALFGFANEHLGGRQPIFRAGLEPVPELWSRMRQRAHLAAGWVRAGVDPDLTAWVRFRALIHTWEERP